MRFRCKMYEHVDPILLQTAKNIMFIADIAFFKNILWILLNTRQVL